MIRARRRRSAESTFPSVALIVLLSLLFGGCGGQAATPAARHPNHYGLGVVLSCNPLPGAVISPSPPEPGLVSVPVFVHIMRASMGDLRTPEYRRYWRDRPWSIAPTDDAVKEKVNVFVPGPNTIGWEEYWTFDMIKEFFGATDTRGRVTDIWKTYGIQLILDKIEDCTYSPQSLRPDGRLRDSIPTPQTSTPWTSEFFRSVSRLFTGERPGELHVLLWWSVAEGDIDDTDPIKFELADGKKVKLPPHGNDVWGYSRSAARGGPAVWIGAYECLTSAGERVDYTTQKESVDYTMQKMTCAKIIAHEVGHALGLHHVETPDDNLMYIKPGQTLGLTLSPDQQGQAREEARRQFTTE